jgi:PPP family 3-phenylpropionic acid transporter
MGLRTVKLHYVVVYGVLAALLPYLPLYADSAGLSDSQIGWVMGMFGVAVLIGPPLYTLLADRWFTNRTLIVICYLLGATMAWGLTQGRSFESLLGLHLMFSLGFTAMIPLLDGLTFHVIRPAGDEAEPTTPYRSIRVWGSVGWMLPGVGLALLWWAPWASGHIDRIAISTAAGLCVLGLLTAWWLPGHRTHGETAVDHNGEPVLPTMQAWRALGRGPMRSFVGSLFLLFMAFTMLYTFYSILLREVGVPGEFVGLITNIGVVVEVGFMLASGAIMRRIGVRGVMLLGAACMVARLVLLAAVPHAWVAIASQVFHGPSVVTMYLIPPMYLNLKAEPSYRNSMQGVYVMLCFGVARIIAAAWAGHVSDTVTAGDPTRAVAGLQAVFALAALLSIVATAWLAVSFRDTAADHALGEKKVTVDNIA